MADRNTPRKIHVLLSTLPEDFLVAEIPDVLLELASEVVRLRPTDNEVPDFSDQHRMDVEDAVRHLQDAAGALRRYRGVA